MVVNYVDVLVSMEAIELYILGEVKVPSDPVEYCGCEHILEPEFCRILGGRPAMNVGKS